VSGPIGDEIEAGLSQTRTSVIIFPVTGSQSNGIEDARYDRHKAERARSTFVKLRVLITHWTAP
jgi:hypothetical protein